MKFDPLEATQALAQADAKLATIMSQVGPFQIRRRNGMSPFEFLSRSIMHQQLAGAAANAIHERFCRLFNQHEGVDPRKLLRMPETKLRGCGLSRPKIASLKDLSAHTIRGTVPSVRELQRMSDEKIIERLTAIRGIGRWTVEMLLIFHLGRPDVLPASDYGVRKGFALVYSKRSLPSPRALVKYGERWRPFRSVASWYLWRALELPPQ